MPVSASRKAAESIDELVRANTGDLLRYFQRRLSDDSDAADALGELLLITWKLRRRVPTDPTQGRMWLFTTAHNVLRGSRRTLARRSAAVERLASDMNLASSQPVDDTNLEVRDALNRLPLEDAELIRLIYWDGLASHEAAAVLNLNRRPPARGYHELSSSCEQHSKNPSAKLKESVMYEPRPSDLSLPPVEVILIPMLQPDITGKEDVRIEPR